MVVIPQRTEPDVCRGQISIIVLLGESLGFIATEVQVFWGTNLIPWMMKEIVLKGIIEGLGCENNLRFPVLRGWVVKAFNQPNPENYYQYKVKRCQSIENVHWFGNPIGFCDEER